MFMPQEASLKTIYSYYLSTVTVNPEGDVSLSDETNHKGLGTNLRSAASNELYQRTASRWKPSCPVPDIPIPPERWTTAS